MTETYAVNAVILARLTRLYERQDWKVAIAQAKGKGREPRMFMRTLAEKRKIPPPEERPTASPTIDTVAMSTSPLISPMELKPEPVAPPGAISDPATRFLYLRVIDDSPPRDQQNVVIPYPVRKQS